MMHGEMAIGSSCFREGGKEEKSLFNAFSRPVI